MLQHEPMSGEGHNDPNHSLVAYLEYPIQLPVRPRRPSAAAAVAARSLRGRGSGRVEDDLVAHGSFFRWSFLAVLRGIVMGVAGPGG